MAKPRILHMLFPGANPSPFDVNMAADAGYQVIVPYTGVGVDDVGGLIQDAIFSRPKKMYRHTGAFIGGWDVNLAAEMLEQAGNAMVPPFELSVLADPNGAYTTAAALVALVAYRLGGSGEQSYEGLKVKVFGGGPVGLCAAVLIARQGGKPSLVRLTPPRADKQAAIVKFSERYSVALATTDGESDAGKMKALGDAQVVITTAKAGVQILSQSMLREAPELLAVADVNAVPPTGVEGLDPNDDGVVLQVGNNAIGVGALAIGGIKYQVQMGLLERMQRADSALLLDFPDAYALARDLVQKS